jgi:hypothetical protein
MVPVCVNSKKINKKHSFKGIGKNGEHGGQEFKREMNSGEKKRKGATKFYLQDGLQKSNVSIQNCF